MALPGRGGGSNPTVNPSVNRDGYDPKRSDHCRRHAADKNFGKLPECLALIASPVWVSMVIRKPETQGLELRRDLWVVVQFDFQGLGGMGKDFSHPTV